MTAYGPYQPTTGDHIIVRRTYPSGRTTTITCTVIGLRTIQGIQHLDVRSDGGRAYLGTNAQLAAIGVTQTVERAPDSP